VDWNEAILSSAIWLIKALFLTVVVFVAVGALLVRTTRWGRQFWALSREFFWSPPRWKVLLSVVLLLLLALFSVRMNVLFSFWYKGMYNTLQAMDSPGFWWFMGLFGILATVHVVRVLITAWVQQAFEIHWREWLNTRLVGDWLHGDAYYRGQFVPEPIDNPDQRVQVDITNFVAYSRQLALGAVAAVVTLVEFTVILWALSAAMSLFGFEIPRAMVFLVYVYVIVFTVVAFKLGRPLIELNFLNEKLGANFRYALVRLREYAENIAFYQGARVEALNLTQRFAAVIQNAWALLYRTLKFEGFNLSVSQVAVVFPLILQAPRFFSGQIKLGDVMQTSQAFGQVQDALSFFRMSYDTFAQYRAILDRLTGFMQANEEARTLPRITLTEQANGLQVQDLTVTRPDGTPLLRNWSLQLNPGEALLVKGASGCGKTTLLRALAGLWPYAHGHVLRPIAPQALFLSQKPYLPLGSLRQAVAYPAEGINNAQLRAALEQVQLGHLQNRVDDAADWSKILSLGEQQRLAFARVLVNMPAIAFLDEASSAMDEGLEHALYSMLRRELPECTLVSVGHRSTLAQFHGRVLILKGNGEWE
jgi:vitamin B12/bleomycin/antimicrobial peptide transport system ATP-binding/permease protein